MVKLENYLNLKNLTRAEPYLVPHILSNNYFEILKSKISGKRLTYNERYYYNHFIKKKLIGMAELFNINKNFIVNRSELILNDRLKRVISLLKQQERIHKNMKIIVSGSFLYKEKYNDIDVFVISKYDKEDYRDGQVHVNYLPPDAEGTLFFKSISVVSISNFDINNGLPAETFSATDILQLYETTVLLIMQDNDYLSELRNLILRLEFLSNNVILNTMQLKAITGKIMHSKKPIKVINKYVIAKIINAYGSSELKRILTKFIQKNSVPEEGQPIYENWKIYNQTYNEALELVT